MTLHAAEEAFFTAQEMEKRAIRLYERALMLFGVSSGAWWLASLMMVLSGNVLVCIGVCGEYMGRIYDDVRARPLYVVARTLGFDKAE